MTGHRELERLTRQNLTPKGFSHLFNLWTLNSLLAQVKIQPPENALALPVCALEIKPHSTRLSFCTARKSCTNHKNSTGTQICKFNFSSALEHKIQTKACYEWQSISRVQIHQAHRRFRSSMLSPYKEEHFCRTNPCLFVDWQTDLTLLLPVRLTYQYLQNHLLKKYHKIYVRKGIMQK